MIAKRHIVLGINRTRAREDNPDAERHNDVYRAIAPKALAEHQYTCQFCELQCRGAIEVHHIDGRHENNDRSNLVPACRMCHLAHHIGFVGAMNAGLLVYLPELSQAALNTVQRTLWVGTQSKISVIADRCQTKMSHLHYGMIEAKKRLGTGSLTQLAIKLAALSDADYARREVFLDGIRLIYLPAKMQDDMAKWIGVYDQFPTGQWNAMTEEMIGEAYLDDAEAQE